MIPTDRPEKLARVRAIAAERGARGVRLTSAASLAWLFDGARVAVPFAGPAVLVAEVGADGALLVRAPANEAARLRDEELGGDVEIHGFPWSEPFPAAPAGYVDEDDLAEELRAARAALLPVELERYRRLGADVAAIVTEVLAEARPETTERALAAELARRIVTAGAEPMVLLVAGEARGHVPHPLPTAAPIGRRAMAVVGARRHGLVVNLTRWVAADPTAVPGEAALREVEADAFAATVPGRILAEALGDIARSYERHGFGADGWLRHHQGGPTGYAGRDPKATPETSDRIAARQAFSWNPWAPGLKLEDTVIVGAGAVDVLTADPRWPAIDVRGVPRPCTLPMGSEIGS